MTETEWRVQFTQVIKTPPRIDDLIGTLDNTPIRLSVDFKEHQDVFVYGIAYVPTDLFSPLGWYARSVNDPVNYGLKCILLPKSRGQILNNMDVSLGWVSCRMLRVLRLTNSNKAVIVDIDSW